VLAAGIIGAFQNAQVKAAFTSLGTQLKAQLKDASSGLVDPLINAAGTIGTAFQGVSGQLKAAFTDLAPQLDHIAAGFGGFLTNLAPGIQALASASKPLLDAFASELPKLGSTLTQFFEEMGTGSKGATSALNLVFEGLNASIIVLGRGLSDASRLFDLFGSGVLTAATDSQHFNDIILGFTSSPLLNTIDAISGANQKTTSSFQYLNTTVGDTAQQFAKLSDAGRNAGLGVELSSADFGVFQQAIKSSTDSVDVLAGAMADKLLNSMLSVDQSTLAVQTGLTGLGDTLLQNHVKWSTHIADIDMATAHGQANRGAVLDQVAANIRNYDSLITSGVSAIDAAAAYDVNTAALEAQLHKAGLTQGAIDGLIGKYRNVPDTVNTDIETHGLIEAIQDLDDAIRLANNLDGRRVDLSINTVVTTTHKSVYIGGPDPYQQSASVFGAKAKGGIVDHAASGMIRGPGVYRGRGQGYLVAAEGVTGSEAFIPQRGITPMRASKLLSQAASWYNKAVIDRGSGYAQSPSPNGGSGNSYNITLQVPPNADLSAIGRVTVDAIKYYEKFNGAGWRADRTP
jgi:Flp pilus assembly pilin Flp